MLDELMTGSRRRYKEGVKPVERVVRKTTSYRGSGLKDPVTGRPKGQITSLLDSDETGLWDNRCSLSVTGLAYMEIDVEHLISIL